MTYDDAVEARALVSEALLASAQSAEVLSGLRDVLAVESELDAAGGFTIDGDVEKAFLVVCHDGGCSDAKVGREGNEGQDVEVRRCRGI